MPSILVVFSSGNLNSGAPGGTNILSGNYWSGQGAQHPYAGVRLATPATNSGNLYIGLSGGMTVTSGGLNTSGAANSSGGMDGMVLPPNTVYFVPRLAFGTSGTPRIFVQPDAACSGQARIHWEVF